MKKKLLLRNLFSSDGEGQLKVAPEQYLSILFIGSDWNWYIILLVFDNYIINFWYGKGRALCALAVCEVWQIHQDKTDCGFTDICDYDPLLHWTGTILLVLLQQCWMVCAYQSWVGL